MPFYVPALTHLLLMYPVAAMLIKYHAILFARFARHVLSAAHSFAHCLQIALTGYPLQNNVTEYYTMIKWIEQPILGDEAEFKELFIDPISAGAQPLPRPVMSCPRDRICQLGLAWQCLWLFSRVHSRLSNFMEVRDIAHNATCRARA